MPSSGGPGQHAIPKAIRAMPVMRATGMATPASSSPSSSRPTSDGTISNARPVAASAPAARTSAPFIASGANRQGLRPAGRGNDDLDAAVLGLALRRVVAGDRTRVAKALGPNGVLRPAPRDQQARDRVRPCRREFAVGRAARLQRRSALFVVGEALDDDLLAGQV